MPAEQGVWEAVGPEEMRRAMGRFVSGVAVVTAAEGRELHGMTVNSLASVALDPPLVLVCLMENARTTHAVRATGQFNLSILGQEGEDLCRTFARRGTDHYHGLSYEVDPDGIPVLHGAVVQLRCNVRSVYPEADHLIVVASVAHAREPEPACEPLVYFGGRFHQLRGDSEDARGLLPDAGAVEWAWDAPAPLSW